MLQTVRCVQLWTDYAVSTPPNAKPSRRPLMIWKFCSLLAVHTDTASHSDIRGYQDLTSSLLLISGMLTGLTLCGKSALGWAFRKQEISFTLPMTEAEYVAAAAGAQEVIWISRISRLLQLRIDSEGGANRVAHLQSYRSNLDLMYIFPPIRQ